MVWEALKGKNREKVAKGKWRHQCLHDLGSLALVLHGNSSYPRHMESLLSQGCEYNIFIVIKMFWSRKQWCG